MNVFCLFRPHKKQGQMSCSLGDPFSYLGDEPKTLIIIASGEMMMLMAH